MGEKTIAAGEYLYREGDVADAVYIVVSGKMELLDVEDGKELQASIIEPGRTLGELAVFDQKAMRPRSARAMEPTVLKSMMTEEFQALFAQVPEALKPILEVALQKMKATKFKVKNSSAHAVLENDISTITVVPASEKLKSLFKPVEIPVIRLPFRIGGFPEGGEASRRDQLHLSIPAQDNPLRVSRQHCEITIENKAVVVVDLGSRFNTRVNGLSIGRARGLFMAPLKKGDNEVILGSADGPYKLTVTCS